MKKIIKIFNRVINCVTGVSAQRKRRLLELRRQRVLRDFDEVLDQIDQEIEQAKSGTKIRLINEKYRIIMWRSRV